MSIGDPAANILAIIDLATRADAEFAALLLLPVLVFGALVRMETKTNADALMATLGVDRREINIKTAANLMLKDIGQPVARGEKVYDVTFENLQASLRADYLFRVANFENGMGDLSELALGWCTYGVGDHMAYYNVNAGAAKTLIAHLIR